jgi:hypothetical protein
MANRRVHTEQVYNQGHAHEDENDHPYNIDELSDGNEAYGAEEDYDQEQDAPGAQD